MPGVPARASSRARLGCRWRHPEKVSAKGDGSFMSAEGSNARPAGAQSPPLRSPAGKPPDAEMTGPPEGCLWGFAIPSLYSGLSSPSLLQSHPLSCSLLCSSHLGLLSSSHTLNLILPHAGFLSLPANTELNVCTGTANPRTLSPGHVQEEGAPGSSLPIQVLGPDCWL